MSAPLVSVAFPCFQQAAYVRQALASVLGQTYSPLEIVVCDDVSTDGTYEIVAEEAGRYQGPHEVRLYRNDRRMGLENYNRLMELCRGEFVVVAHSDDVALPHRVERLVQAWQQHKVSLVSSNAWWMLADGPPQGLLVQPQQRVDVGLESLVTRGFNSALLGAALAWEPEVFTRFGPLNRQRSAVSSDWILPFRAALLRGIHYVDEPLLHYRVHPGSRGQRFLHHQVEDDLAHKEADLANATSQYVYMLQTLLAWEASQGDRQRWQATRKLLMQSVLRSAADWTLVRKG